MSDPLDQPDGQRLAPRRTEAATTVSAKKPRTPEQMAAFAKAQAALREKRARDKAIREGGELPAQLAPKVAATPDPKTTGPEVPIVAWPDESRRSTRDASEQVEPDGSVDASNDGTDATVRSADAAQPERAEARIEPLPDETPATADKPLIQRLIDGFKEGAGL